MGRAIPMPVRTIIMSRMKKGHAAAAIAAALDLKENTVRKLMARFRHQGQAAVAPNYQACGQHQETVAPAVTAAALALRQEHPHWGAGLIRVHLAEQFPTEGLAVVSERSLQRAFAKAGLGPAPRGRRPQSPWPRATAPHAVWQMDAADQLRLASGQRVSWLRLVDEFTGAFLATTVFEQVWNSVPAPATQAALRRAFTVWGRPALLRVDNGWPWGSHGDLPVDLVLWLAGLGVRVHANPPSRPKYNGVVERAQGTGQRWAEPGQAATAAQLQQTLDRLDRLQRERYPYQGDRSRQQVYPGLAHSGRLYRRRTEAATWDVAAAYDLLADYVVVRQLTKQGSLSLYNRNHYVSRVHAGQPVYVSFDPQAVCWLFHDAERHLLHQHPAPELAAERIVALTVSHQRPKRPARRRGITCCRNKTAHPAVG